MKTILIGQAPSRLSNNLRGPLSSKKLADLAGLTMETYLESFERINILGRWPGKNGKGDAFPAAATRAAARINPHLRGHRVVFMGRAAARAFGFPEKHFLVWREWFYGGIAAILPHPSGINMWWNNEENVCRARNFIRGFL